MATDYGQTLDGVRALLPHRSITETSRPSQAQVELMLANAASWVEGRARGRLADPDYAHAVPMAAHTIELYAAAQAEDASYPERADRSDSSYGNVLWERFRAALADLLGTLGLLDAEGDAVTATVGSPAYAFPAPLMTRSQGF